MTRSVKAQDRACKLADSGGPYLRVQPNGSKLWRDKSGCFLDPTAG